MHWSNIHKTQLCQLSMCTVWYIYTFTVTQAISTIIPSRVLWAAWLTSVPVNRKQNSHFFIPLKGKQQHKVRVSFIRGNKTLCVLLRGWERAADRLWVLRWWFCLLQPITTCAYTASLNTGTKDYGYSASEESRDGSHMPLRKRLFGPHPNHSWHR